MDRWGPSHGAWLQSSPGDPGEASRGVEEVGHRGVGMRGSAMPGKRPELAGKSPFLVGKTMEHHNF